MPFGKHRGKKMKDIPVEYYLYLHEQGMRKGALRTYVINNLDEIKKRAENKK